MIARSMMAIAAFAALLSAALPAGAAKPEPSDRLKQVERDLETTEKRRSVMERKADGVAAEIQKLKVRLVRIAEETQAQEGAVSAIEREIDRLGKRISSITNSLRLRRSQMIAMLAALERLSLHSPVALAAQPGHPVDTVRSAILMRTAIPALKSRSETLKIEIAALSKMRAEIALKRAERSAEGETLKVKRRKLARLVDRKSRLERRARAQSSAAKARATELAAEAEELKDLLARLESERRAAVERKQREDTRRKAEAGQARRKAEAGQARRKAERLAALARDAAETKPAPSPPAPVADTVTKPIEQLAALAPEAGTGQPPEDASPSRLIALPARGRLTRHFGERSGFGAASKGLTITTRPAAQVTAPREGQVVFAGPFRGYGKLLIVRHDDGHHALLSGMARIHAVVGDRVLAGEPLGIMGSNTGTNPTLYLELRRKGQPVNPLPWLTASRSKASG